MKRRFKLRLATRTAAIRRAKLLRHQNPTMTLDMIAADLNSRGHVNTRGQPFTTGSVGTILGEKRVPKRAKLTPEDERQIFEAHAAGASLVQIAQRYTCAYATVCDAARRYMERVNSIAKDAD